MQVCTFAPLQMCTIDVSARRHKSCGPSHGEPASPRLRQSSERSVRHVLGNEIAYGLQQHVLLRTPEVDSKLLEGDDGGVVRVVIATDMQFGPPAGLRRPRHRRLRLRDNGWWFRRGLFSERRTKEGAPSHGPPPYPASSQLQVCTPAVLQKPSPSKLQSPEPPSPPARFPSRPCPTATPP
jgi:hypothetical protein